MASVFLSYDRDDARHARAVAAALEKAGHSVWWDQHIGGGSQYSREIEQALNSADVVVVLWSRSAVESAWVRDEAGAGRDRGRLIPLSLEGTLPPLGFRQFQAIDLGAWRGRGKVPHVKEIVAAIERQTTNPARPASADAPAVRHHRSGPSLNMWAVIAVSIGMFLVVVGLLIGRPWETKSSRAPTILVSAADTSPRSHQMARDLLINLGNLQSVKSGSMTLVNERGDTNRPDLLFQASDTTNRGAPSATLSLVSGKDHGVLWSRDFDQPSGKASDLIQQLSFAAGRALGCALDGVSDTDHPLDGQTLKTYLNACARLSDLAQLDAGQVIPMLRQVTAEAPHFEPAWAKLLLAQAEASDLAFTNGIPDEEARNELRRDISAARKLFPGIAEADLAESVLLPPNAYGAKLALINSAAKRSPDNPDVLSFQSAALQSVGRLADAIGSAGRAVNIDPLSPAFARGFVYALAYAGYFDSARDQLAQMEKLWPGTASENEAYYTFHFRYGDPKIALGMDQTKSSTPGVLYLIQARMDRSPANIERLVTFLRGRKDRFRESAGSSRLQYYMLAMAAFHQDDELFDTIIHWFKASDIPVISAAYFRPELHDFRSQPRFLEIMKTAGLLDYWQKSGQWPDFCFETDMPYDCKKEAAKLKT
jgi:hypothetical protein